jgi:leader peptidase (prepilin peptidase) / N-methyltransferase
MTLPLVAAAALFGLMIGSFLNVCIARIPEGESIASPGSRCPRCRTPIRWYDNLPVVSYLLLGGKCRSCKQPISARYPAVELITAIAFAIQAFYAGDDFVLLASRLIFTALLIVLFGTDYDVQRLPNVLTLPGLVVGLGFSVVQPPGLRDAVIGALLGAGILQGIRLTWYALRGVEGMGFGDVKMLAMIGAFLGWRNVIVVLFFSSLAGAVVGIALTVTGRQAMSTKLPFGTFMAVAAFAASLYGERLAAWYVAFAWR